MGSAGVDWNTSQAEECVCRKAAVCRIVSNPPGSPRVSVRVRVCSRVKVQVSNHHSMAVSPGRVPGMSQSPPVPGTILSVIVPTFNEEKNVEALVDKVSEVLAGISFEIIFVDDDSPDNTAETAWRLSQTNPRVRCIKRIGRRGLSSACIEGFLATSSKYLAVMDGDLQHDETLLKPMLEVLQSGQFDLVLGSRYIEGGGVGDWDKTRAGASRIATKLATLVSKHQVSDPMSGFFMIKRSVLDGSVRRLAAVGFKILLDILASSPSKLRIKELPYHFRDRDQGESKFDSRAVWEYLYLLLDKSIGRVIPTRFASFCLVGGIGVLVHLNVLAAVYVGLGKSFILSQSTAALAAMTFNYWLNNMLTYADSRRSGIRWVTGWLKFVLVCSLGAVANVGVANFMLTERNSMWLLSGLAGVCVGAVWNFAVSSIYTWEKKP